MIIGNAEALELGVRVERLEHLDSFLAKAAQEKVSSSIAICVLRRGVEVFSGAYGPASPGGPPLKPDMITDVASVTKPVTATMVMMLQEDGLLDIVDPLKRYYPELAGSDKEGVTLRHLLTHVSGMDEETSGTYVIDFMRKLLRSDTLSLDSDWEEMEAACLKVRGILGYSEEEIETETVSEFLDRLMLSAPLKSKPGTQFSYFNPGYRVLANIVERLSGETMDVFAQRRIFEPLGMIDSHFVLPEEKWPRVLLREETCRGAAWFNSVEDRSNFAGSSGLKTTVFDMARFGLMFSRMGTLNGARILSPASVRAMTMDYNQDVPPSFWHDIWFGSNWGLGWNVRNGKFDDMGVLRSDSAYDHAGYGGARLMVDPEHDLVVAFYMVDENEDDYILHGKTTNIVYSALD